VADRAAGEFELVRHTLNLAMGGQGHFHAPLYTPLVILHKKQKGGVK
jgi:hypothetical protein